MSRPSDNVRVRAIVRGRVQGVWYRGSTQEVAEDLALVGWVRNRADGDVELEAEGPPDAVDALIAWCRHGPPAAVVMSVEVERVPATGADRGFRIAR